MSLVEEELGGPSVFKDLAKLDFDYVPETLPGREDAIRWLSSTYRGLTQGANREHALLWGPVGTGKTAVAKLFARSFKAALQKQGRAFDYVHVNCRSRKSDGLAMLGIMSHFDPHYPDRGFSVGEMLRDLKRTLDRKGSHLLVILDEVDALLKTEGSSLVYDLTRFNSEGGPAWAGVSVVMISQENVLSLLDPAALSTFKQTNAYEFKKYESQTLESIVQQRVELAFVPGAVEGDTVCLVADIVAAQSGNARLAIEILQKAGRMADDEGKQHVGPEEVRAAKAYSHDYITTSKLQQMPQHPLLVLLALARRLKKGDAYATTGAVEQSYKVACEEFGEEPRAHTQFWKYLKQLEGAGFLLSRLSGKGQAGTTQMLSIPDAPAKAVEEQVLALLRKPAQH
ncbi:MAG TPA: AAA family ATPase [Candidatus Thermoplasmatota archaeon]|nr:AAA family ATPase [Candidatus Thermoplasmatota archaeon]